MPEVSPPTFGARLKDLAVSLALCGWWLPVVGAVEDAWFASAFVGLVMAACLWFGLRGTAGEGDVLDGGRPRTTRG